MKCRHCDSALALTLVDLAKAPPSNAYLLKSALEKKEKFFPLHILVCQECWLVQTEDFADAAELFDADYAYFSGFSKSWLQHAQMYVDTMVQRFGLNRSSHVVEVAANDGYLLQYVRAHGIGCTGVEPTASTAAAAREKGIDIVEDFFCVRLAQELARLGKHADLMAANNVLAHVPDINDFVRGFSLLLKPAGVATFEFPHVYQMVRENQFDTIYHEHFSYLSLSTVKTIFEANGLAIFDVEELPTHGGSLRVFAQRSDTKAHPITLNVGAILRKEAGAGMLTEKFYLDFQQKTDRVRDDFKAFLVGAKKNGKRVAAYGAAAKGNTLMNYAGVHADMVSYVVDANPAKQGKFMPGSHVPIVSLDHLMHDRPDYVVIFPWNLKNEIMQQLTEIRSWNGKFVIAVPHLEVL